MLKPPQVYDSFQNELQRNDKVIYIQPGSPPSLAMGNIIDINYSNYGLGETLRVEDLQGHVWDRVRPDYTCVITNEQWVWHKLKA